MTDQDTICAVATAQGGAIASIRVSGPQAIDITGMIFTPAGSGKKLDDRAPYTLTFGRIRDGEELVDEALVGLFRAPHSYTGENSTEITCHGSSYILQQVVQLLIRNGCRTAQPGEFTQRAFLNGKMDLSQAEAVADLIASTSAATHRLAISQMRGGFSKELAELRGQLLNFTSMIELELDFSEEDVEFADRKELCRLAGNMEDVIARLVNSFSVGNAIRNGVPVAIIGETNAGKSTLLNVLLNEEKAIVSEIHGTTRDAIEDTAHIEGVTFRFIDTAGIRDTEDTIENLGIERTFRKIEQAEIVLWVMDSRDVHKQIRRLSGKILPLVENKQLIIVLNKTDLLSAEPGKERTTLPCDRRKHTAHFHLGKTTHTNRPASKDAGRSGTPAHRYPKRCDRDQCTPLRSANESLRSYTPCTAGTENASLRRLSGARHTGSYFPLERYHW